MDSIKNLILGYCLIIVLGFLLLCLPFFHVQPTHWINHLFVATSSVSTTGLLPFPIIDFYNWSGQLVILIFIQIGGIGYMSLGALTLLLLQHKWQPKESELIKTDLGIPQHYNLYDIIKVKIVLSLLIETLGAIVLFIAFKHAGVSNPIWQAIFHSVSAFCTAGISLFPNGLESFSNNFIVTITISVLCYTGALGFIVFTDVWQRIKGRRKQLSFTSFIILKYSLLVASISSILFFLLNTTLYSFSLGERVMVSLFHIISACTTAGFDVFPISGFPTSLIFLICLLMIIGASPTGTGGGVKITTFSIILAQLSSSFRQMKKVILEKTEISDYRVRLALASLNMYVLILCLSIFVLTITEKADFLAIVFECISAFSTVGLSLGLTTQLTDLGKLALILVMFIGRIGVLSIGLALFVESKHLSFKKSHDIAL